VAGHVPLVTAGMEIVPAADYHFKKTEPALFYVEVYEPLLRSANPPKVGITLKIVDTKTGTTPVDIGIPDLERAIQAGNPVIPLGLKVPVDKLEPGSYRLELQGLDSAGNSSPVRSAEFAVD
jgi:hypothetical protein